MKRNHRIAIVGVFLVAAVILSFFLIVSSHALTTDQNPTAKVSSGGTQKEPSASTLFIKPGERLNYGIYSTGIRVGSATITYLGKRLINNQLCDLVRLEAKAPGFYDKEVIYGDIATYAPVRVERSVSLFGKNMSITEEYKEKEVKISHENEETNTTTLKTNERMGHVVLLLYYLRFIHNFKTGESLRFVLPTKTVQMSVEKTTKIHVPYGNFNAFFVKSVPPQFKIWLKNEGDRIPVRIDGAIGFGSTYLALTGIETL